MANDPIFLSSITGARAPRAVPPDEAWRGQSVWKTPAVPVKVFQIGSHKVGTNTIWKFFENNGYKGLHWEEGRLAKDIAASKAAGVRPFAAWSDIIVFTDLTHSDDVSEPIEAYRDYAYLDKWYPEAVFLLNTRPVDKWLLSRIIHDHGIILKRYMRYYKITDPIPLLQRWKEEWFEHLDAVRDYFADRPEKLVEFDIESDGAMPLVKHFEGILDLDPTLWGHENKTPQLKWGRK